MGGVGGAAYLTVLQVAPLEGRNDVQLEARIGFQSDAPIDDATLSDDSFYVANPRGAKVAGELALDEDDASVVVFKPAEPLEVITTFTATITTELAATGGATLQEDYEWDFRTLDAGLELLTLVGMQRSIGGAGS
jgi:hypothetical protein